MIDSKELEQLIRVQTDAGCSSVDDQGVAFGADARRTRVRSEIRKFRLSSQHREVNEISHRGAASDNARTCAWKNAHIASGPRAMAATPVRATSTRPSGFIRVMKVSIFDSRPVISKTK